MAFGANKGSWLFGANSIVANNQATLNTGSAVVAKGDLIVVVIGEVVANTSSGATDTLGNTYTAITAGTLVGATVSGRAFYTIVTNPGTNTNINVQATASSNNVAIVAASYEGQFSAIDKQPANNNNTDNSSPFTCPATGTLAQQLEVIVAWMVDNTANVKTATSPNIKANQQSQTTVSSVLGSQVVNVTTTVSPAFTGTNPTASIQGTASFRAAPLPAGEVTFDRPIPPSNLGFQRSLRTFIAQRNLNLLEPPIPPPEVTYTWRPPLYTNPRGPEYHVSLRSWTAGPQPVTPPPPPDIGTVFRGPLYTIPRAPEYSVQLRSSFGSIPPAAVAAPFAQDDWPVPKGFVQPIDIRTIAAAYNPNLVGKDQLPTGEIRTDLTTKAPDYHAQLRHWSWQYNLNLLGKDALPAGEIVTDLPPKGYVYPLDVRTIVEWFNLNLIGQDSFPPGKIRTDLARGYEHHVQLRNWTWQYNPNLIAKDAFPPGKDIFDLVRGPDPSLQLRSWFGAIPPVVVAVPFSQEDWPNPRGYTYPVDVRTITEAFNLNLVGQDKLPSGEVVTDLPPRPAQQPTPIFVATYNKNLVGKDQLPVGAETTTLPPQPALSAIQLRTWINYVALALVTPPAPKPFAQYDWPLNFGPLQPVSIFAASYNKNLIGKDQLPNGAIVSDLPPRQAQQPTPIFTAAYNKNLIGKDQLPSGSKITDLAPQPALSAIQLRTWIQTVNLALTTQAAVLPFNQTDWPVNSGPRQPTQVFTASFNKNLIGQDQLPVGEINTTLPAQQRLAAQTWINAVNLALTTVAVLPFNQLAWPLSAGPRQPDRSYGYAFPRTLIGQDRLPVRQQDWPLYRPFLQPALGHASWYNRNLVGKDRLPIRQQYWPVPPEFRRLSDWIVRTNPNLFVPPIPPPEILPRDPTHLRTRGGFEMDARGDASIDRRGAGVDARGPASVERRGSDRFNRGRNES